MKKSLIAAAAAAACVLFGNAHDPVSLGASAFAGDDCQCSRPRLEVVKPRHRDVRPRSAPHRVVVRPTYDNLGHQTNWMQMQGFRTCAEIRASCYRGANKPGHGLAYEGVCEVRYQTCRRTGCWSTTHTGGVCGLARH